MCLTKRFQYYVRPTWFVIGWILLLLIWLFYLPTPEIPLVPLSIRGVALLSSPFILYRYWRNRPPQLTLSSERLDESEVGLPVNHINEMYHKDGEKTKFAGKIKVKNGSIAKAIGRNLKRASGFLESEAKREKSAA